jgi:hypothetical protein
MTKGHKKIRNTSSYSIDWPRPRLQIILLYYTSVYIRSPSLSYHIYADLMLYAQTCVYQVTFETYKYDIRKHMEYTSLPLSKLSQLNIAQDRQIFGQFECRPPYRCIHKYMYVYVYVYIHICIYIYV